jgi:hypothetical protein
MDRPWRLRLAVHRMVNLGDLPLADVWSRPQNISVREGLTLRLGPIMSHGKGWATALNCGLIDVRSTLLPESPPAPIRVVSPANRGGKPLPFHFALVAHDPDARENTFSIADLAFSYGGRDTSWGLMHSRCDRTGLVGVEEPLARYALGLTTFDQWLQHTTVQVWVPEERGTVDLTLSPAQVKQLLAK